MTNYTPNLRDHRDLENSLRTYKQEGVQEGRQEEKDEIALNLIKEGFSDEIIGKVTGLSLEKIAQIRKVLTL